MLVRVTCCFKYSPLLVSLPLIFYLSVHSSCGPAMGTEHHALAPFPSLSSYSLRNKVENRAPYLVIQGPPKSDPQPLLQYHLSPCCSPCQTSYNKSTRCKPGGFQRYQERISELGWEKEWSCRIKLGFGCWES